jgi:hypothetical protein
MIRRIWIFLAITALFTVAGSVASADTIDVGTVSYDPFIADAPGAPGANNFDVANYTGDPSLGGNAFPPFFPVLTFMNFNDLSLSLSEVGGTVLPPFSLGSLVGPGDTFFDSADVSDTLSFASATLTGNFSATTITLSDGTVVTIGGSFSSTINPSFGNSLVAGVDYAVITAQTEVVTAPEPSILILLGCSGFLVFGLFRSRVLRLS